MTLRVLGFPLLWFILGVAFLVATAPANNSASHSIHMMYIHGDRTGDRTVDREAIRAHIDSIFQAFIKKDAAALRATHAQNWLGYLEGSRTMIRGIEGYMEYNYVDPKSPYGMKSYKMREFDMIFKGDAAFVCFVADIESNTPNGPFHRALRISDF